MCIHVCIHTYPTVGATLGDDETQWIALLPRRAEWYCPLKVRLQTTAREGGCIPRHLLHTVLHIIRCLDDNRYVDADANANDEGGGVQLLANLDLEGLVATLEPTVKRGLQHPNSLVRQRRTTRSATDPCRGGDLNRPGHGLSRRWCAAARAL